VHIQVTIRWRSGSAKHVNADWNFTRGSTPTAQGSVAYLNYPANHISKRRPEYVVPHGKSLWLDPGQRAVNTYVRQVVNDVVRRYDIDGIHFDDYFYPYPQKDDAGQTLDL
jgi:uncharacterized lipoprotein YddW (UPF0748 family)